MFNTILLSGLLSITLILVHPILVLISILSDVFRSRKTGLTAVSILALLNIVVLVFSHTYGGAPIREYLFGNIELQVDVLSFVYVISSSIIVLVSGVYFYYKYSMFENKFTVYTMLSLLGYTSMFIAVVNNWFIFALLWEALSFTAYYFILSSSKTRGPQYLYYMTMHVTGFLIIIGVAFLYSNGVYRLTDPIPSNLYLPVTLIVLGFISKAGIIPFHYWVQKVYDNIDPAYSALFSSIIDPIGIYGLYRLAASYVFPLELRLCLIIAALSTIIVASIWYWGSKNLSSILAWSTIYNMSWMMLIAVLPVSTMTLYALSLYLFCHGLAKASAFIVSGIYGGKYYELRSIDALASFLLAASILSIEGVPPFNLFFAKIFALKIVFDYLGLIAIIPLLGWISSSLFFFRIFSHIIFPNNDESEAINQYSIRYKGSLLMNTLIAFMLVLTVFSYWIIKYLGYGGIRLW